MKFKQLEVGLHEFLTLTQDVREWSASYLGLFMYWT